MTYTYSLSHLNLVKHPYLYREYIDYNQSDVNSLDYLYILFITMLALLVTTVIDSLKDDKIYFKNVRNYFRYYRTSRTINDAFIVKLKLNNNQLSELSYFDEHIKDATLKTAEDILKNFNPSSLYIKPNEIYVLYSNNTMLKQNTEHIVTTLASYASVRLSHHIVSVLHKENLKEFRTIVTDIFTGSNNNINGPSFYFTGYMLDGSTLHNDDLFDYLDYIMMLQNDCINDYVLNKCKLYFKENELLNKSYSYRLEMLKEKLDLESLDATKENYFRYGTIMYKDVMTYQLNEPNKTHDTEFDRYVVTTYTDYIKEHTQELLRMVY